MRRYLPGLSKVLVLCAVMLPVETATAQQAGKTGLHDDTSGRIRGIPIRKEALAFANASADLTFDLDYTYKASTLVGEPLLLCGATLSNPRGTVAFTHRGTSHQVEVTPQNADKINPYHLDMLIEYRLPDSRVFYASCDTGLVGTWAREAYNLSSSPPWGRFLCELGAPIVIAHYVSTRPRPNRIDREWCASMQGRYLEAEAAKELFRARELRASGFVVASLSLDVADLVLDQTRTGLAERIAQRMQAQLEGALSNSKPGILASTKERETWEALNGEVRARLDAAAVTETATERARALREAIRTVLAAEGSDDGSAETLRAVQQALASRLSDQAEREFAEREREEAKQLQGDREAIAAAVATELQSARAAADAAPEFRFASQSGPADIVREVRRFIGHEDYVWSVSFSPDGRYVLSGSGHFQIVGSRDHTARLWDVATGQEVHRFSGHSYTIWSVAFSPDGRKFLTTSAIDDSRLWDAASGNEVRRFAGEFGTIRSLAFSPDGRYVVAGGGDGVGRLWETESGNEVRRFVGHSGVLWSVAFSPDGRFVLTGGSDKTARLWDAQSGAEVLRFVGHMGAISSVAFSPDGQHVLTGAQDATARLWDVTTGEEIRQFPAASRSHVSVDFSPDGRHVLTAAQKTVHLWDTASGQKIRDLSSDAGVLCATFSPDGRFIATCSDKNVILWGPAP